MTDPVELPEERPVWRRTLARPLILSGILILLAAILSLIGLVYLSYASAQRLDPLARHLEHLQALQKVSLEVQSALVNEVDKQDRPDQRTIEKLSIDLRNMLRKDGYLHKSTPARILAAQNYLLRSDHSIRENLGASFEVLQKTLRAESEVQRGVIVQSRRTADREFLVATFSLVIIPVILVALLLLSRRWLFAWSTSLSEMLENVRQSDLASVRLPDRGTAIYPVIERYNAMVERLREIEAEHVGKEQDLQHQVQVASDGLIRLQRSLSQAEQLSALGEFSARIAHELRNPLSGITVALRNLKSEDLTADQVEVIDLVLEEMDRISRLLDSLLARTPREKERARPTHMAELCNNMIALFGYESDPQIEYQLAVTDSVCDLPRDSLRQAILNILRNSAQAMGSEGGRIAISGKMEEGLYTLAIEDSGPGYPEDLLRDGIRPFRTDKLGGSGLGLSIIQRLIHNAGGQLRLENAATGGARTVIEFPCSG